jgi:nucleoid-associated protein YgaU
MNPWQRIIAQTHVAADRVGQPAITPDHSTERKSIVQLPHNTPNPFDKGKHLRHQQRQAAKQAVRQGTLQQELDKLGFSADAVKFDDTAAAEDGRMLPADAGPAGRLPNDIQSLNDFRFSAAAGWLPDDAAAKDTDKIQTADDYTRTASAIAGGDDRSAAQAAADLSPRDAKLLANVVPAEKRDFVRYGGALPVEGMEDAGGDAQSTTYVVQPGDNLWKIADEDPEYWQAIKDANPQLKKDPDHIEPGWEITLPPKPGAAPQGPPAKEDAPATPPANQGAPQAEADTQPTTYVIQSGDSLWKLAKGDPKYWQAIVDANPQLPDPSEVFPGDKINLPPKPGTAAQQSPAKEDTPTTPPANQGAPPARGVAPDSDQSDESDAQITGSLEVLLKAHEGKKDYGYLDSEGHPTIGHGHKFVWGAQGDKNLNAVTGNQPSDYFDQATGKPTELKLTATQIQKILELDMADAVKGAHYAVPFIDDLDPKAAEILVEMAFQMGGDGLKGFEDMITALSQDPRKYDIAADEILESLMATQTPGRAQDYADRMRSLAK